jgi:hypothetical protein
MKYVALIGCIGLNFITMAAYGAMCQTQESVEMGQSLRCTAAARSAGPSDFYFSPGKLSRGHHFLCYFTSSPVTATLLPERSRFPEGMTFNTSHPDYRFPLQLKIDAANMTQSSANLNFAYEVSPSDMPAEIEASCQQADYSGGGG